MKLYQKIAIGVLALLVILVAANFGLNFYLQKRLPKIIQDNNQTPYEIGYQNLQIKVWSATIQADSIVVKPKIKPQKSDEKLGIYSSIEQITINQFSVWNLIFHNTISADNIEIFKPETILYYKKEKKKDRLSHVRNDVVAPFQQIIKVKNLQLKKGHLTLLETQTSQVFFEVKNIEVDLEGIVINKTTLQQKIPFKLTNYDVKMDSMVYQPNPIYRIKIGQIATKNHELKATNFELAPLLNRHQFVAQAKKEKDLFIVKAKELAINQLSWGFKKENLFFKANAVLLDQVDANIYRNKIPADDMSKKKLYSEVLRNLKFALDVRSLEMRDSKIVYEEEVTFDKGPAILTFDRFNLKAKNIKSGLGLQKTDDLTIAIHCIFMKNSALKVDWNFNVLDKSERFHIKGSIANFDVNAMKRFTRPYMNASFDGKFKSYHFDIWGNDINSKGNASLYYDNLDVTLYKKKEPHKKSKLKSGLANLFVKKDSDNKAKTCTMEVERIQEKSFYNFLWRNVAESLKKILI
ncbi:hypothetical protein [Flavobacterium agrisoli]|uniref:Uncharacterized protein n=1 Tax=Flavobacterium agrisoli TaxID=2793066 RepID=A0A934PL08_9FLAO|nr:hypothetical protein [Flavobacterium agrisoli]MBK0369235.1 hypothetical protein [Flavobacterium agrisoli]